MLRVLLVLSLMTGPALAAEPATDKGAAAPAQPLPQSAAQPATVVPAAIAPIEIRVPVSGSLVAWRLALVYPQLSGAEVTELLAEPGDQVTRGQVLARLSDLTVRAQLAQAEAEAQRAAAAEAQAQSQIDSADAAQAQAVAALQRTRQLQSGGSASRAALDQVVANEAASRAGAASARNGLAVARAARAQAEAARDLAKLNLERTQVVAPVDGVVRSRDAQIGAMGGAGDGPMFTIVADGTIEWQAEVVETALGDLKLGDTAIAAVAGVGAVAGRVRLLPASVNPETRLGELRIALDPVAGLKAGLFASGWVIVDRHDGLTVPLTAVLDDQGGQVVQVVKGGIVETRPVEAGAIWQGRREILAGLSAGEQVIARAGAFFRAGDRVEAVPEGVRQQNGATPDGVTPGAAVGDDAAQGATKPDGTGQGRPGKEMVTRSETAAIDAPAGPQP